MICIARMIFKNRQRDYLNNCNSYQEKYHKTHHFESILLKLNVFTVYFVLISNIQHSSIYTKQKYDNYLNLHILQYFRFIPAKMYDSAWKMSHFLILIQATHYTHFKVDACLLFQANNLLLIDFLLVQATDWNHHYLTKDWLLVDHDVLCCMSCIPLVDVSSVGYRPVICMSWYRTRKHVTERLKMT